MSSLTAATVAPAASPRRHTGVLPILVAALAGAAAGAGGLWLVMRDRATTAAGAPVAAAAGAEAQRWQCPMHPSIVQDHPGDCPICGMKLVLAASAAPAAHHADDAAGLATVVIDPARQQLIGLRTAAVDTGAVGAAWRTVGRVAIDETRVRHINIKIAGYVERVYVDFVGKAVAKGEPLFSIFSPDLVAAQEEYVLAHRTRGTLGGALAGSGDELLASARRKLELLDVPAGEIDRLDRTGKVERTLTLRSPLSGVVTKKDVVDGMQLPAGAMPYEIVDLSSVWVLADVYESDLGKVAVGSHATLTLKAYPLRRFEGKVSFIDPVLDARTRTVKVRLSFPNRDGQLKPEMFGEVVLETEARVGLRIPVDAVIHSGTRNVVFVALGDGKFQPREVRVGDSDGQLVELVDGLAAGDQVVTRANFLVDSESRLRASLAAMTAPAAAPAPAPARDPHAGHAR